MVVGLLRFTGAVRRDPQVDAWFDAHTGELGNIARRWFARMRKCGADVTELVHDGCPTACVADAPFAYANAFRSHVNVGFFHGDALADPAGMLRGDGRFMRHVSLSPDLAANDSALEGLIAAAYLDIKTRLKAHKE